MNWRMWLTKKVGNWHVVGLDLIITLVQLHIWEGLNIALHMYKYITFETGLKLTWLSPK